LTCKHVVKDISGITLSQDFDVAKMYQDNKVVFTKGKLVAYSQTQDFAIIEIKTLPYLGEITRYSYDELRIGDEVFYFGLISRPGKLFFVKGYVAQLNLPVDKHQTYNSLYSNTIGGTSGATIFNAQGLGIGIMCQTNDDHTHSFYLPIRAIRESLQGSLLENALDGGCNHSMIEWIKEPIKLP
jgi:hypothetical protein